MERGSSQDPPKERGSFNRISKDVKGGGYVPGCGSDGIPGEKSRGGKHAANSIVKEAEKNGATEAGRYLVYCKKNHPQEIE